MFLFINFVTNVKKVIYLAIFIKKITLYKCSVVNKGEL